MPEENIIEELTQIEQRLAKAWVQNDRDTIESILASDWTVTDITGRVMTKLELMQEAFGSEKRCGPRCRGSYHNHSKEFGVCLQPGKASYSTALNSPLCRCAKDNS